MGRNTIDSIARRTTNHTDKDNNIINTVSEFYQSSVLRSYYRDPPKPDDFKVTYGKFLQTYKNPNVDAGIIEAKIQEANEKRFQEEAKEYMNEWGLAKSSFREDSERKHEIKKVVEYYDNNPSKARRLKLLTTGQFNPKKTRSKQILNTSKKADKNDNAEFEEANNILKNLALKNNILNVQNDKLKEMKKDGKVQPIDVSLLKKSDSVFNIRKSYGRVLDVKEVDDSKANDNYYNPLSLYDSMNLSTYSEYSNKKHGRKGVLGRPTSVDFIKTNIGCGSYLDVRKTSIGLKMGEVKRLEESLSRSNSVVSVRDAFLPPVENITYSKYFLPKPGYGIVCNDDSEDDKKSKKGKKSKKKKDKK
jgi:hypothetical protein